MKVYVVLMTEIHDVYDILIDDKFAYTTKEKASNGIEDYLNSGEYYIKELELV